MLSSLFILAGAALAGLFVAQECLRRRAAPGIVQPAPPQAERPLPASHPAEAAQARHEEAPAGLRRRGQGGGSYSFAKPAARAEAGQDAHRRLLELSAELRAQNSTLLALRQDRAQAVALQEEISALQLRLGALQQERAAAGGARAAAAGPPELSDALRLVADMQRQLLEALDSSRAAAAAGGAVGGALERGSALAGSMGGTGGSHVGGGGFSLGGGAGAAPQQPQPQGFLGQQLSWQPAGGKANIQCRFERERGACGRPPGTGPGACPYKHTQQAQQQQQPLLICSGSLPLNAQRAPDAHVHASGWLYFSETRAGSGAAQGQAEKCFLMSSAPAVACFEQLRLAARPPQPPQPLQPALPPQPPPPLTREHILDLYNSCGLVLEGEEGVQAKVAEFNLDFALACGAFRAAHPSPSLPATALAAFCASGVGAAHAKAAAAVGAADTASAAATAGAAAGAVPPAAASLSSGASPATGSPLNFQAGGGGRYRGTSRRR